MRTIVKLLSYLKHQLNLFIFGLISIFILSSCEVLFPWIFKFVVDILVKGEGIRNIHFYLFIWMGVFLLWGIFKYIADYLMLLLAHRFGYSLRKDLFAHLQGLSLSFFQSQPTGKIMSQILNDVDTIEEALSIELRNLFTHGFIIVGCLGMMLFLDWRLFVVSVVIFPLISNSLRFLNKEFSNIAKVVVANRARVNSFLQEIFSSIRVVKAFTRESKEIKRFDCLSFEYLSSRLRNSKISAVFDAIVGFVNHANLLTVFYVGFLLVSKKQLTVAALVTFIYYLAFLRGRFSLILRSYIVLRQGLTIFEGLIDLKSEPSEENSASPKAVLFSLEGRVEFKDIWFKYATQEEPILKGVSFRVNPKDKVVIVGESGTGKTTLFNLLMRFYQPVSGKILLDDNDISGISINSLRKQVSIVSQDDILFNSSVEENIAYGKEDAKEDEIIEAAKIACIHQFILSLPRGYKTIVGEKGAKLSGGERQRISLARAVLRNPSLLLLDEAVSNLNENYVNSIYDALGSFLKDKTAIIVTHRAPSSLKIATKVMTLGEGVMRESVFPPGPKD